LAHDPVLFTRKDLTLVPAQLVDLHAQTLASEGIVTLSNQFAYAKASGLRAIAITDLDVLPDIEEAQTLSLRHGVDFVPGIEISAGWAGSEVHIIGYCIDAQHPKLREKLSQVLTSRIAHMHIMLYKLGQHGINLSYEDLQNQRVSSVFIGRIDIARAMVEKGYISKPREAFTDRLIGVDGECYYPTHTLSASNAISLIIEAGGIAVLAHPALYNHRAGLDEEDIQILREAGLRGIEALHACHTPYEVRLYSDIANRLDLLITGGSGCRGVNYDKIVNYKPYIGNNVLHDLRRKQEAA